MTSGTYIPSVEEIGGLLAASLFEGTNPDRVEGEEFQALQLAGVPIKTYVIERLVLRACAGLYTIRFYSNKDSSRVIQAGFNAWFAEKAKQSPVFEVVQNRIQQQLDRYTEAAISDEEERLGELVGQSYLAQAFSDALTRDATGQQNPGGLALLTMSFATSYWDAIQEVFLGALKKSNIS